MSTTHTESELAWEFAVDANEILVTLNPLRVHVCRPNQYIGEANELSKRLTTFRSADDLASGLGEVVDDVYRSSPNWLNTRARLTEAAEHLWQKWRSLQHAAQEPLSSKMLGLKQKADGGDLQAAFDFGWALVNGDGVMRNQYRARAYMRQAADAGMGAACASLASWYEQGLIERSWQEAKYWYLRAADVNHPAGTYLLGLLYAKPELGTNVAEAARWIERAADLGDPRAQIDISLMYYNGDGVQKDSEKAKTLFARCAEYARLAAARGNGAAQYALKLFDT